MRALLLLLPLSLVFAVTGCLSAGISQVDAEPGFDWNTLKRDEIVMTPLIDLRDKPAAPAGHADELKFFTDEQRLAYPESFKQVFFKIRKDVHVYGAGGAFESLAKIPNLQDAAAKALAKEEMPADLVKAIDAGRQDKRFVFFFAMVEEKLGYDYEYHFRQDRLEDQKIYRATRAMTVRLALWDTTTKKTVWRGTEHLEPSDTNTVDVLNPTKRKVKKDGRYIFVGQALRSSLSEELANSRGRFPGFPGREPSFSGSFEPFALALPIQPSEEKLIEYEHFSYHRPELGVRTSALDGKITPWLALGFSSAINYKLRFGGTVLIPMGLATFDEDGTSYEITASGYGATFDYEWTLSDETRLLTGVMLGGMHYTIDDTSTQPAGTPPPELSDSALAIWPRAFVLFGKKAGFQWGAGAAGCFYSGLEEPLLRRHRPAPWSADVAIAYAFRGF